MRRLIIMLWVSALCSTRDVHAENWPGWRGPRGDGSSHDSLPLEWNGESGKNIAWKTAIPGEGYSSPIVWDDTLFVTTCNTETLERILICIDRDSGKPRWQRTVLTAGLETKHRLNSHASGTPVTDGSLVYVPFLEVDGEMDVARNVSRVRPVTVGNIVVAAYDFDGNQKWIARPGKFVSCHGFCSSPVIHGDLVIVNGDHDGDSYVCALDRNTGETVWKYERHHETRSYVTPIIRTIDGRTQLVLSGSRRVVSLNPTNGDRHWLVEGPTEQYVASMVCDGSKFYAVAGFPTHHVVAIRPDGVGDVTDSHVDWHVQNVKCYVPSPVLANNKLLVADDRGTANCFDTATGERLWQGRLGRHFSASLLESDGLVYFFADDGIVKVVRPDIELDVVAKNPMGEWVFASPAASNDTLFVRGETHLFAIREEN